jgi:hypothetical protein
VAINYSAQVYHPTYDVFARPVTFTPVFGSAFEGRGIYSTQPFDVLGEDSSIFSDQVTILDVLDDEFTVVPIQGDIVFIPTNVGMPELGTFEVTDADSNGGGETTLTLRRVVQAKP